MNTQLCIKAGDTFTSFRKKYIYNVNGMRRELNNSNANVSMARKSMGPTKVDWFIPWVYILSGPCEGMFALEKWMQFWTYHGNFGKRRSNHGN